MVDEDADGSRVDRQIELHVARARRVAAVNDRDSIARESTRLRAELAVIASMMVEIFRTLHTVNPCQARMIADNLLWQHQRYQRNPEYPDIEAALTALTEIDDRRRADQALSAWSEALQEK